MTPETIFNKIHVLIRGENSIARDSTWNCLQELRSRHEYIIAVKYMCCQNPKCKSTCCYPRHRHICLITNMASVWRCDCQNFIYREIIRGYPLNRQQKYKLNQCLVQDCNPVSEIRKILKYPSYFHETSPKLCCLI